MTITIAGPKRLAACHACKINDLYNPLSLFRFHGHFRPILYTRPLVASVDSSLALKVRGRGEESNALIHDRLAHPQIVIQPLLHAGGVAELIGLYTGTERQPVSLWPCCRRRGVEWRSGRVGRVRRVQCGTGNNVREAGGAAHAGKEGGDWGRQSGSAKRLQKC